MNSTALIDGLMMYAGLSYETYWKLARFGFLMVIVVMQIPAVRGVLQSLTRGSHRIMAEWFGVPRLV